jgi:hypothetical protein
MPRYSLLETAEYDEYARWCERGRPRGIPLLDYAGTLESRSPMLPQCHIYGANCVRSRTEALTMPRPHTKITLYRGIYDV